MKYFDNTLIEELQKDIEIPACVQQKAEDAFHTIEQGCLVNKQRRSDRRIAGRKVWAAAVAAVLVLGTVTVGAAAYMHWSRFLEKDLNVTDEQKRELEENKTAVAINKSATAQGITVTAMQTLINDYYAHIIFKVEGYELPKQKEPAFESVNVSVDEKKLMFEPEKILEEDLQIAGAFWNGLVSGEHGEAIYADGTSTPKNGNVVEKYIQEDGSMEYSVILINTEEKGYFNGKPIHIEFKNMGTIIKKEYQPDIEATWSFDWILESSDIVRTCEMKAPLGDSGAAVVKAEVSPISLCAVYKVDEKGTEPPELTGVKLKDGTMYPTLYKGPGVKKYTDKNKQEYVRIFAINRVLDVDEVESLLFIKFYPEDMETYTEDNFYIVPLK